MAELVLRMLLLNNLYRNGVVVSDEELAAPNITAGGLQSLIVKRR
jgi:hypothetical protein